MKKKYFGGQILYKNHGVLKNSVEVIKSENVNLRQQLDDMRHSLKLSKEMMVSYRSDIKEKEKKIQDLSRNLFTSNDTCDYLDNSMQSAHNSTPRNVDKYLQKAIEV